MHFSFDAAFRGGGALFKRSYGVLLGATVVMLLVMIGAQVVSSLINASLGWDTSGGRLSLVDLLVKVLVANPLTVGIFLLAVLLHRGESPGVSTVFAGFRRFWVIVGVMIILDLILLGVGAVMALLLGLSLPIVASSGAAAAVAIGPAVILVVGLIIALWAVFIVRLGLAPVMCVDPRRRFGVGESLGESWRATGSVYWPLLGMWIVLWFILIASIVLLLLPAIFVGLPLVVAISGMAYVLILDRDEPEDAQARAAPFTD